MPIVRREAVIRAPIEGCFDLARDAQLHVGSVAYTGERIVEGRSSGFFEEGETVNFEASHFGVRQRLTSRIEVVERLSHLRDVMIRGAFKHFAHDHSFHEVDGGTLMTDVINIEPPVPSCVLGCKPHS